LTVKVSSEKSGFPTSAAISGVIKSLTRAATTAPQGGTDYDRHGQIDHVPAQQERLELLSHGILRVVGLRLAVVYRGDQR